MSANILVVDDALSMRAIISSVVESIGQIPIQAKDGEEALQLFAKHDIDIVVLDVEMPGINGFEVCKKMRQMKEEWFPVIYLSSNDSDDFIIEGLDAGGDAYVTKPIHPRVLQSIIEAMSRIANMKSELREANKELEKLAQYDGLTQILNRRGFDESLANYWAQAQREDISLTLILLDVDHFKDYNDFYGHLQGDDCLKQIASALESNLLRPLDLVARYGGEEFGILLPKTELAGTPEVAQRLLDAVQDLKIPHEKSSCSEFVSVSMGIASSNRAKNTEDLISKADKALYKSKESGRNRYTLEE